MFHRKLLTELSHDNVILSVAECSCSECSVYCVSTFTTSTTLLQHVTIWDFGTKRQRPTNETTRWFMTDAVQCQHKYTR